MANLIAAQSAQRAHNATQVQGCFVAHLPLFYRCVHLPAVTRPRDQAVDAELFSLVTEAGLEYVGRLKQGGRAHTAGDFIRRLKTHFVADTDAQAAGADDPDAFNW